MTAMSPVRLPAAMIESIAPAAPNAHDGPVCATASLNAQVAAGGHAANAIALCSARAIASNTRTVRFIVTST